MNEIGGECLWGVSRCLKLENFLLRILDELGKWVVVVIGKASASLQELMIESNVLVEFWLKEELSVGNSCKYFYYIYLGYRVLGKWIGGI